MASGSDEDNKLSAKVAHPARASIRKVSNRANESHAGRGGNNSGNNIEESPSEVESSSQLGRQSRASIRVKWRETASAAVDNETEQFIPMQPISSDGDEAEEGSFALRRSTAMVNQNELKQLRLAQMKQQSMLDGDSVDIRVVITGMHRVGKTCLAECLAERDRKTPNPVRDLMRATPRFPGVAHHTAVVTPRTCCYVTFFDAPILTSWPTDQLAEWDTFRFPFISTTHALIIVFDLTCPESFDYVKRVKSAIITAAERQTLIHCPPLFIVGNKADCVRAKTLPRKEDLETLVTKGWMRELEVTTCDSLHYCEVSAATGWKVHDLLSTLVLNHLEQHMSLGEAASAAHQRQRQRMLRDKAKLDRRARRRRRRQSSQTHNCLTQ